MDFLSKLFTACGFIGMFAASFAVIMIGTSVVAAAIRDAADRKNSQLRAENIRLKAALDVLEARIKHPPG